MTPEITLPSQGERAGSPTDDPLTAPSPEPRPDNPEPARAEDTPGAPLGDAPATGKPKGNRGEASSQAPPLTISFRLRLEPGAQEREAAEKLWGRYLTAVRHVYRRAKHYTNLYPTLPKKERHLGDCSACHAAGVEIRCVGPGGPLCAECHAPYTETGLWQLLYPRVKEATLTRLSRKKGQEGVRITRHYPPRLPKQADNLPLAAPGLTGTLYGEAFAAGVALVKMRRQQAALFRRRADFAEERADALEGTILAMPPCDDPLCLAWRRAGGRRQRKIKNPRCGAAIHKAIRAKRNLEREARRWGRAWQRVLSSDPDLSGISLRLRGPSIDGGVVRLPAIGRRWSAPYSLPAAHRARPRAWFGGRLQQAMAEMDSRSVYCSIFKRDGAWWLNLPMRFNPPARAVSAWLGVWPMASHVALSALTADAGLHKWSACLSWGLSGSDLRRARAGWDRHRKRAVKWQAKGRRYRLNRKLRTTHIHTRATVATDTHRLAKRIVEAAEKRGLGIALPSPRAFSALSQLPVAMLLSRIAYKARIVGLPVKGPEGYRDGLFVPLVCPECRREGLEGDGTATCPCGLSLARGLARARVASLVASGLVATERAGPLEESPASGSGPPLGPGRPD